MRLSFFMTVVALFCFSFVSPEETLLPLEDPVAYYSMIELVCAEGYHIQEHVVVTDDGYVLKVYRIPNGKRRPKVPKGKHQYMQVHLGYHPDFEGCVSDSLQETPVGPPVLLAHGLTACSDGWVLQGGNRDLAFMLADKGYDVWFSNIRGNFYSRQHKTLKPSDIEFWDFSFHENGIYDIPTTIDLILNRTGAPKLTYIGHSMGTTMFFVMSDLRPEYKDKIQLFVGLTPVAQLLRENFSRSRLTVFKTVLDLVKAFDKIGVHEFLPRNNLSNFLARLFCWKGSPLQDLCYDLTFVHSGFHSKLYLRKKLVIYLAHGVSGSSVKTFLHYDQMLEAPYFRQYDYGPEENIRKYGQADPPRYNLESVTVPTALFYSKGDYIAYWKDISVLKGFLPNIIEEHQLPNYSHLDFLWAYNAKELVYRKVMDVVDRYRIY